MSILNRLFRPIRSLTQSFSSFKYLPKPTPIQLLPCISKAFHSLSITPRNFISPFLQSASSFQNQQREYRPISEDKRLFLIHFSKPRIRKKRRHPLDGNPQMKGIVLKTLVKKPKKPNSANRKCVLVRLSNGKEATAYVPGEGHNLQEHNVVLVQFGRVKDVPGLRLKVIRGKYDCSHVVKKTGVIR